MAASVKPTISIDRDLQKEVDAAARAEGVSFSAWIAEAARDRLRNDRLGAYLDELDATYGPLTADELNAGRAVLGLPPLPAGEPAPRRKARKAAKAKVPA